MYKEFVASCKLKEKTIDIDGTMRDVYHLGYLRGLPNRHGLGGLMLDWCVEYTKKNNKFCCVGTTLPGTAVFFKKMGWHFCGDYNGRVIISSIPISNVVMDEN